MKEREIYGLNSAITGEFFHDALDRFVKVLISENISLTQLTMDQRLQFVEKVLQEIFGEVRYTLLSSSARMNFIRYQLGKTIQRVAWALTKQGQKCTSHRKNRSTVWTDRWRSRDQWHRAAFKQWGQTACARKNRSGRCSKTEEEQWLSVVDYKSSSREFDLTEAYYGLAMQLITYLDVALNDAVQLVGTENVRPAGAYYLHVHDPVLDGQKSSEEERLKQFKYDGLFLDEPSLFPLLDHELSNSSNSAVFPIRKDKSGTYQKTPQAKTSFTLKKRFAC